MTKIHRLGVGEVDIGEVAADPEVVERLKEFVTLAEEGRLRAFALVGRVDSEMRTRSGGTWEGRYFEAIGAIECLKYDMLAAVAEDY